MCGLTGFWDFQKKTPTSKLREVITLMTNAINHRGPNDQGTWVEAKEGIALGHARLSILDLSPAGAQPMVSPEGRYVLSYNGEIYNFSDLKTSLAKAGYPFKGHSDTEVLLAGITLWGVEKTLKQAIGMFAFALWDAQDKMLILGRDRMGVKPLYYGRWGKTFYFGSQPKSFRFHPGWKGVVNQQVLANYLHLGYIPTDQSIFEGMQQVKPGCFAVVTAEGSFFEKRYWNLGEIIQNRTLVSSKEEALLKGEDLLKDAISKRMVSDVPIGAFLSGGVDSSLVAALMQAASSKPIHTFSIGFLESAFDESAAARAVADHLGTIHTELKVTSKEALNIIPDLPKYYDEPFADSSAVPTMLLSKLTRQHVTVALSGDGGDELFGGYNRYLFEQRVGKILRMIPHPLRKLIALGIQCMSPEKWNQLGKKLSTLPPLFGDKLYKFADILPPRDFKERYNRLIACWPEEALPLEGSLKRGGPLADLSPLEYMQFEDMLGYLPGDILTKVDRASMAYGLEAREPLLDHRLVEFSWSLPESLKIHQGTTKYLLREILYKYVPKPLIERPKMGFAIPLAEWLRGPLREWADSLLEEASLTDRGFKSQMILKCWQEHLSSERNWQYRLWTILMYQAWHQGYSKKP